MSVKKIKEKIAIPQNWNEYSDEEHEIWRKLYKRQMNILENRACNEFLDGVDKLEIMANGIPNFDILNKALSKITGWEVIAVKGLIPDEDFFECLANKVFPAGSFIRRQDQFDYISEPDIFHDVFGHVPLLTNQIFANYMQEYGKGGLRAVGFHSLKELARLYWYSVEFGLIQNSDGLKIYGAGILSSPKESISSLEDNKPNRIKFNLERIMRTDYRIYDVQDSYFVIDSFDELFAATLQDFAPIYSRLNRSEIIDPINIIDSDEII